MMTFTVFLSLLVNNTDAIQYKTDATNNNDLIPRKIFSFTPSKNKVKIDASILASDCELHYGVETTFGKSRKYITVQYSTRNAYCVTKEEVSSTLMKLMILSK